MEREEMGVCGYGVKGVSDWLGGMLVIGMWVWIQVRLGILMCGEWRGSEMGYAARVG